MTAPACFYAPCGYNLFILQREAAAVNAPPRQTFFYAAYMASVKTRHIITLVAAWFAVAAAAIAGGGGSLADSLLDEEHIYKYLYTDRGLSGSLTTSRATCCTPPGAAARRYNAALGSKPMESIALFNPGKSLYYPGRSAATATWSRARR